MVQLSYLYMTTGKIAFTIQTLVGKVMSLLFNITQGQRGRQFRSHAALGDELGP